MLFVVGECGELVFEVWGDLFDVYCDVVFFGVVDEI